MRPLTTGISAVLFSARDGLGVADAGALRVGQQDQVDRHGGVVVDTNGAGVMATFDCPAGAQRAAAGIAGQSQLGVGVAFGEVTVGDDARVGEAVVQAARLSELASAGQVLASESLRDVLAPAEQTTLELLGVRDLRGLPDPVAVFDATLPPSTERERCERWHGVLSIDMVESSELLTAVGEAAMLRVRALVRSIVDTELAAVGGRTVDSVGDGVIAVAPTVSGAVDAARAIHRVVGLYRLRADADARFWLRVGIDAGSVDPARMAAQEPAALDAAAVEGRAPAGATTLSEAARSLANHRVRARLERSAAADWIDASADVPALALPSALGADSPLRFVGRARQLADLDHAWEEAVRARPSMMLVSGEPGIGKTRLVGELARSVVQAGALVLYGVCDADVEAPYQPFVGVLRQLASLEESNALAGLDPESINSALAAMGLGSELADFDGADVDSSSSARNRSALFDHFVELLAAASEQRPVLLVLDDLHWATSSTVQLLQYVLDAATSMRVLVVVTFRDAEIDAGHPFQQMLGQLHDGVRYGRLSLVGLSADDVAEVLCTAPGQRLDDSARALALRVHGETNGSPFFTGQLLSEMTASGTLRLVDDVWTVSGTLDQLPITETVRGVVGQRLERSGADVRSMLTVAAVAGHDFELDLVAEVLDEPADAVLDRAELAVRSGLVIEGDHIGGFRFVHAIVRSSLLDGLSATRRAQMHRRIGEALERLPGSRVSELAHHWVQASTPHDQTKAITYLRLAAQRDANALAWEAAVARYREVLDLLQADVDSDLTLVAETWLAMGQALRAEGDLDYLPAMEEAARRARRADRPDLLAQAAMGCLKPGTWFANANETDRMLVGLCEDALYLLPTDDPLRVRVLATLATNLTFDPDGTRDRREKLVGEALGLARSIGDVELLSAALVAEFLALWDPSTFDRRVEVADELQLLARRTGDDEVRFLAGFFQASCLLEAVDVDGASRVLAELAEPLASTENFWFQFLVERVTNAIRIMRCDSDMGAEVDALFERSADTQADGAGTWAAQHGALAIQQGRFATMVDSLRGASERSTGQGIWHHALTRALVEAGEHDQAVAVLEGLDEPHDDFMWLVSQQFSATAAAALGHRELCEQMFASLTPYRGRLGVVASGTIVYELVSTTLGRLAAAVGWIALATELFREALADADRIGAAHLATVNRVRLASLLADDGECDVDELRTLLAEAGAAAERFGFAAELAELANLRS